MTADITPERIEELRQQHIRYEDDSPDAKWVSRRYCQECADDWPCPTIALLDALEEARRETGGYSVRQMKAEMDQLRLIGLAQSKERDQLRQELEEARRQAEDCYGKEMCRGFRDSYWVVARERDQLRAELGPHQLNGKGQCPMCYSAGYEAAERELRAENERLRAALKDAKDALLWSTGGWRTEGISESELVPAREALRQFVRRIESALSASPEQEASQ